MSDAAPPSLAQVCERALSLPSSPALLPRLSSVLQAADSTADDIAAIIKLDPALTASTLRLANSAYFSGAEPAATVSDAVVRLGQQELYRLAALALVSRWESGSGHLDPGDFCRHALCTALAAEALAETSERVAPPTAYTAGLVCDLGKLAVAHSCSACFAAIRGHVARQGGSWAEAERAVLGYTHADVGARLLQAWSFPPVLQAAAQFGEHPAGAPDEARDLVAHLHAAKYVATSFGPGVSEEGFLFEFDAAFVQEYGFTAELLQETMAVVHERAKRRLQDKLTHGPVAF